KVSVVIGLFIASPVVLMQLWRFITPGLYPNERRMAIPFILSSIFLFCLGAFFAWLTFPAALKFLLGFGGAELAPFLSAERYITFMLLLILAFGVSFELPVVLQFLMLAGAATAVVAAARRSHPVAAATPSCPAPTPDAARAEEAHKAMTDLDAAFLPAAHAELDLLSTQLQGFLTGTITAADMGALAQRGGSQFALAGKQLKKVTFPAWSGSVKTVFSMTVALYEEAAESLVLAARADGETRSE